jgi:hypothetical protein
VEKFGTPRHVTDDNLEHAQCMLDTKVYKHTIIICNIHCFSTAIILTRTRLIFALCFHCLSCLFLILLPFVFWHQQYGRCVSTRHRSVLLPPPALHMHIIFSVVLLIIYAPLRSKILQSTFSHTS